MVTSNTDTSKPLYRVGMVSRLTGVSTHTLRMWEKRYAAVVPQRTPAGDRLYSDKNVWRLTILKKLVDRGHSISGVANLADNELENLLHHLPNLPANPSTLDIKERFLDAVESYDSHQADGLLARAAVAFEPRDFALDVVVPILSELGDRWEAGELRISHEHFASSIIRNLLLSVGRTIPRRELHKSVILCTPEGEHHEFGVLTAGLLATLHGWKTTYLGTNLPADEIRHVVASTEAPLLLMSLVNEADGVVACLEELERVIPETTQIVIGGALANKLSPKRARVVPSLAMLEDILR